MKSRLRHRRTQALRHFPCGWCEMMHRPYRVVWKRIVQDILALKLICVVTVAVYISLDGQAHAATKFVDGRQDRMEIVRSGLGRMSTHGRVAVGYFGNDKAAFEKLQAGIAAADQRPDIIVSGFVLAVGDNVMEIWIGTQRVFPDPSDATARGTVPPTAEGVTDLIVSAHKTWISSLSPSERNALGHDQ